MTRVLRHLNQSELLKLRLKRPNSDVYWTRRTSMLSDGLWMGVSEKTLRVFSNYCFEEIKSAFWTFTNTFRYFEIISISDRSSFHPHFFYRTRIFCLDVCLDRRWIFTNNYLTYFFSQLLANLNLENTVSYDNFIRDLFIGLIFFLIYVFYENTCPWFFSDFLAWWPRLKPQITNFRFFCRCRVAATRKNLKKSWTRVFIKYID